MPVPAGSIRLSLTGHLYGGDIFNISHWWYPITGGTDVPDTNTEAATLLDAMTTGTEWTAYLAALAAMIRSACGYDAATLYSYPVASNTAAAQATKTLTAPGTSTTGTLPNQVARVVTLRTDQSGRSYRGRVYLPACGLALDPATGLFSGAATTLLSAMATWIGHQGLTNSLFGAVVSPTRGQRTSIVSLKTDQRPDIQRRRANRETTGTLYTAGVVYD